MSNFPRRNSLSDAVKERRLRPIYELLESLNNKKVVQEADRLLKKQPGFVCVKVLKALALLRLGKKEECLSIIAPVFEEIPTEESTIQALSMCYRELEKPEMVCQLLENACKKDKSEDLMTCCFMSHVRVSDFQKQHQTAMALYKLHPKVPYFSWAVMSLYAKCVSVPDSDDRISLTLAERMMAKFITDNQIQTEHEKNLYLLILLKQNKFDAAYKVMLTYSKEGIAWKTGTLPQMMNTCLRETNQTEKLMEFYESQIVFRPLEFYFGFHYVREFGKIMPERVKSFLLEVTGVRVRTVLRGVLLGRMLLFKIVLQDTSVSWEEYESDFYEAFHDYIHLYGGKPFFFFDIDIFLKCIKTDKDREELIEVAEKLAKNCKIVFEKIQRYVNVAFLQHYFKYDEISTNAFRALECIETHVQKYITVRAELKKAEHNLDRREGCPHDDFLTMASIVLVESFWVPSFLWKGYYLANDMQRLGVTDTQSSEAIELQLMQSQPGSCISNGLPNNHMNESKFNLPEEDFPIMLSLAILEYGLKRSQTCSQLRVLLGKVYMFCGAVVAGTDQFMRLDIKHCQIESLGYLYLWKTVSSGVLAESFRVLNNADSFYTSHHKESVEHIISAYKYGSWEQIIEFMDFRNSILRSAQGIRVKVEKRLLEYTREAVTHDICIQVAQREQYDAIREIFEVEHLLKEKRDFQLVTIYCKDKLSDELKDLAFEEDKILLKIRGCLLSILNNFVLAMSEIKNDTKFSERINDIKKLMPFVEEMIGSDFKEFNVPFPSIDGPWSPKIYQFKERGFLDILFGFVTTLFKIAIEPNRENVVGMIGSLDKKINDIFKKALREWVAMKFLLSNFSKLNEEIFSMIETLGFCCVLTDVLRCFLLNLSTNTLTKSKKKKGKDSEASIESSLVNSFHNLMTTIGGSLWEIENLIGMLKFASGEWFPGTWTELEGVWKEKVSDEILTVVLPSSLPLVMDKLNTSYYRAFADLKMMAVSKRKYAETLSIFNQ